MTAHKLVACALAFAFLSTACLPLREHTFNDDIVQSSFDVEGPRATPKLDAKIDVSAASFNVTVEKVVTCERERREKVQRWRETKKTTNSFLHGALYALGVLAGAAGGGIIADNVNNDDPALRTFEIGSTVEEGRDIGIAVAGGGAALLVLALGSSIRAADDRKLIGNVEREVPGSKKTVDCERTAAAAVHLGIVFAASDNQPIYVPLGMTSSQGRLSVPWLQIIAMLPAKAKADGQLVAGPANAPGPAIASVTAPINTDPELGWQAALKIDNAEGYKAFVERFPQSTHIADATTRMRAALVRDASRDLEAALATEELDRATKALEVLRANAESSVTASAQERVEKLRVAIQIKELRVSLPKLLAEIEAAPDPSALVTQVKTGIEQLRAQDPELATRSEEQLTAARGRLTTRFVGEANQAFAAANYETGHKLYAIAVAVAVDAPAIEKQRTKAYDAAVRKGRGKAQDHANKAKFAEAIAVVDALLAIAPQNKNLAADKARFAVAMQQREAAEQAKAEREAKRREAAAARDAANLAEADRREAAAKAAREKAAQEKADREAKLQVQREKAAQEKADREAAANASREKREADRKAREEAAKRVAEEKRLAAIADKERRQAEQRAKADAEARKKAEIKRKAAIAKLDAQVAKVQVAAVPSTLQFALPQRYATDDVLGKLPIPAACQANKIAYTTTPTTCTQQPCRAREMTRSTLTCGALRFVFTRDQTSVWLTCEGQTCADCLALGKNALGTLVEGNETLTVVQACKR